MQNSGEDRGVPSLNGRLPKQPRAGTVDILQACLSLNDVIPADRVLVTDGGASSMKLGGLWCSAPAIVRLTRWLRCDRIWCRGSYRRAEAAKGRTERCSSAAMAVHALAAWTRVKIRRTPREFRHDRRPLQRSS